VTYLDLARQKMGDSRYKSCKGCGRPSFEVGILSWTRLCSGCSHERLDENITGLHTMTGPPVLRWRRQVAASVGAVLIEDIPTLTHGGTAI